MTFSIVISDQASLTVARGAGDLTIVATNPEEAPVSIVFEPAAALALMRSLPRWDSPPPELAHIVDAHGPLNPVDPTAGPGGILLGPSSHDVHQDRTNSDEPTAASARASEAVYVDDLGASWVVVGALTSGVPLVCRSAQLRRGTPGPGAELCLMPDALTTELLRAGFDPTTRD
ncbi:hypothetical protein [Embleya sp. MST-111070]|uniref:hypothetical protein n=1 Tax=Embleya sp. MST-111070 TaxID=3398231 RepID=UPI003F73F966